MSDVRAPAQIQRASRAAERRKITMERQARRGFSKQIERWMDAQITEGKDWKDAARSVGLTIGRAKILRGNPRIMNEMWTRSEKLRKAESARNPVVAAAIRDRGLADGASAADRKVALEAARYLDGDKSDRGGTTNNFNGPTVIAGYVIDLSGESEGPRQISRIPARVVELEPDEFAAAPYPAGPFKTHQST